LRLERAQLALLAALAASVPVSIFAAQALLALSVVLLAARLSMGGARIDRTSLDTPLLAFAVWTLLSASFAQDPARAHEDSKKLVLFVLFYLGVEVMARGGGRDRVVSSALLGGLALASLMVLQRLFLGYDRLMRRPDGFLGHYMSASGVAMCVLLLAVARLVLGRRPSPRPAGFLLPAAVVTAVAGVAAATAAGHEVPATRAFVAALALVAGALALVESPGARAVEEALPWLAAPLAAWALVASQTRSAWAGALAGLAVVAALRAPRLLWLVAAGAAAVLLLRPAAVTSRLTVGDDSSRDRYYMWQAGIDMVLDKPVFGQGPGMILAAYPRYRWPEATHPMQPHLHDNLLQVAAERGLPGLAFFLWWVAAAFAAALGEARRAASPGGGPEWTAGAALAALAAVFLAGLFEYNLGDSEVLMLVLLMAALPFALARSRATLPA
jgi:O-antigen ligase